jgi:hypothetical protein
MFSKTKRMHFDGQNLDPRFDKYRLENQLGRVFALMKRGNWHTLQEISELTGDPQASVSSRLRDLRKEKFGQYVIKRRSRGPRQFGVFEYRLEPPKIDTNGQRLLF